MTAREIIPHLADLADPSGSLTAYLTETSFYRDPASTRYHRSYVGGLADHCLGVFLNLRSLLLGYPGIDAPDAKLARIALCHDLCKVGRYQQVVKSQKKKGADGQVLTDFRGKPVWEDVPAFEYAPATDLILGHGDSSLFLAMRVLGNLAPDEAMAIRFHMGAYDAAQGEGMQRLSDAMTLAPLVILTQAADLMDTYQGDDAAVLAKDAADELKAAGILPAGEEIPS